ncbi:YdiU family protein [Rhodococcus sp. IEGM 1370]|uniref:protein adenylyltransferase SelO n=1 Tax=Rhodococcus sp. IEGM 1370 TaxID=3082222 RepID=UPI002953B9EA|nr:YdiU family protein [Rhodococcus sp. IEGM 1370]MDV8077961.1 YdiU family protein [Rhodococcus sp. IEGM 1370]
MTDSSPQPTVPSTGLPAFGFETTFADEVPGLTVPWQGTHAPDPRVLILDDDLARSLALDPTSLRTAEAAGVLSGSIPPAESATVAMAYAGHQFGNFVPLLGDGRALLLGELRDDRGHRVDLHLKGSGATPFSRGGDGRAVVGAMLREYLISAAMHALHIPTTRSLAVVTTGEQVVREGGPQPGAVLARVASSHLRVGTFEFAARREGLTQPLADYAIARHYPALLELPVEERCLAFFEAVVEAQASLVAQWMSVGFVHGVMNTDNTTISGETIDYGPCAFLDSYDPATVFSSIDHGGRYAYGNQPAVLGWNLARFGETLLPLVDSTPDTAITALTAVLDTFGERYRRHYSAAMALKLGLANDGADAALVDELHRLLTDHRADWTLTFRALAENLRGDSSPFDSLVPPDASAEWLERWRTAVSARGQDYSSIADGMDRVNPAYIPRNHLVDAALRSATEGDLEPFERLLDVVTTPFDRRDERSEYALPAPANFSAGFRTFCGT